MADVDIEKIEELDTYASLNNFNIIVPTQNLEVPEDPQFGKLSMEIVNEAVGNILVYQRKLHVQLREIVNNYRGVESSIDGPPDLTINIGDAATMVDGMKYTEISNGEGDFGVIGEIPWRQASDNYIITGVACYVNGSLVSTDYESGANIDDIRKKIAQDNHIDVSDVDVQVATSLDGDKDTGWISYDELKKVQRKKNTSNSLEDAFDKIDEAFKNNDLKIENKTAEIQVENYDFTNETASLSATLGESAMKEGVALVRTPLNLVTGTVDIATNIVTIGHGTHIRKYENKALDEIENFWEEELEKNGAANLDKYQPWYDISSDIFWMAMGEGAINGTKAANAAKLAELYKEQKLATAALETAATAEELATATETLNFLNETIKGIELTEKTIAVANMADNVKDVVNIASGTGSIVSSLKDASVGDKVDDIVDIIDTGAKVKYVDSILD